jgi:glycosyltransferase involved in cell wall biosynthesis
MKVAYLGPFVNSYLRPFLPDLSEEELRLAPGMGGYGLVPIVIERIKSKQPTILITLDDNLPAGRIIQKQNENFTFFCLPRRKRKAIRNRFDLEVSLIQEVLSQAKPDLIHAHWTYEYAWAALRIPHGLPVLVTVRDHCGDILRFSGFHYLPFYLLTRWVLRQAKYLTVVSPHVFGSVVRLSRAMTWLVPNAVAPSAPLPTPAVDSKREGVHIVSAGNDSPLKNLRKGILAFRQIRRSFPGAVLDLCGSGLQAGGKVHAWAKKQKADPGIVFHGNVSPEHFLVLLEKADIYLHTSRTEACNNAVAEAMVSGIPVVGGITSGGIPWQLNYGNAGVLVDVENPESIAAGVLMLLNDRQKRVAFSKKGREYGQDLYDIHEIMDRYEAIYLEIQKLEKARAS